MKLKIHREHWVITIVALIAWTIIMRFFLYVNMSNEREQTEMLILYQSQLMAGTIMNTWLWNASHGGVFVPLGENIEPNQYLDEHDRTVTTQDGTPLVRITPTWMGQGIGSIAGANQYMNVSVPSKTPINPLNTPNEWDMAAFEKFEQGESQVVDAFNTFQNNGELRYMIPLYAAKSCLVCHTNQGYQEGSLIGGLKIEMFSEPFVSWYNTETQRMILSSIIIWIIGCVGIVVTMSSISKRVHESAMLNKFEGVLEMAGTAAHELNQPLQIISGYAELISMLDNDDQESMNKMLEEIRNNIIRLSVITRKLNNITRYETIALSGTDRIIDLDRSAMDTTPIPATDGSSNTL